MSNEFKLVPVEPTDEMKIAGGMACQYVPDWEASMVYEAMLAAAPQPPALGADLGDDLDDALRDMASVACQSALSHGIGEHEFLKLARTVRQLVEAPLQAEIERHKANAQEWEKASLHWMAERDQLKARLSALEDQSVWQPLADDDLAEAEKFINDHTGKAAFFSKDAATLGNYAMHCIREVRASRHLKARCDAMEAAIAPFVEYARAAGLPASLGVTTGSGHFEVGKEDWRALIALSKPAGSEQV